MADHLTSYQIGRQLRRIFASTNAKTNISLSEEDCEFIQSHPFPTIEFLAGEDRTEELKALMRRSLLPQKTIDRALYELRGMSVPFRLLLTYPELAASQSNQSVQNWQKLLKRWNIDLGTAYPELRIALCAWRYSEDDNLDVPATDGKTLYYPAKQGDVYENGRSFDYKSFLHLVIHCLFSHLKKPDDTDVEVWDLACDIAAESLLMKLFPEFRSVASHAPSDMPATVSPTSARAVSRYLANLKRTDLENLSVWYRRDDHRYWHSASLREDAPFIMGPCLEGFGEGLLQKAGNRQRSYGLAAGSREEKAILREEARYDFSTYLKRFSTIREEMQLDTDGFDYIPYYYGLERYGNMPLIEPLETTEVCRVETLAIAIDTSGSCTEDIVQHFLAEIQSILMDRENFFKKMNVHIFQCDSMIQDYKVIHSVDEWKNYRDHLVIKGRGGTNFAPVFQKTERLIEEGQIRELKGLMYFTDGDGAYPKSKPSYETAFVFTNREFLNYKIPDWIVPLCLDMN